ncbi:MAG: 26S proteasome regulatory subunit N11 [Promethearchaeota archaeon CR_4]|nr:MAG: 26S proteasome regulatory subunit N11 [Candidatus Lokiarchaeota archaeon CR_4]
MIPISHGGSIEVTFSAEDYVAFSLVDAAFAESGLFTIGWFHTHPGLDLFLSTVDVRNHLYWQTVNPLAIAIVFDHVHLQEEGNLGFKIFRLNDVQAGQRSDFHEVPSVIKPPSDLNLYKEGIKQLIDNLHMKMPVILEINEIPDVFGDLKIPGKNALQATIPDLNPSKIIESFKEGMASLGEDFMIPLSRFLVSWSQEISTKLVEGNGKILQAIAGLRELMNRGIQNIVNWFKYQVGEKIANVEEFVDNRFESLTAKATTAIADLKQIPIQLKVDIDKIVSEKLNPQMAALKTKVGESLGNLEKVLANLKEIQKNVQIQDQSLGNLITNVSTKKDALGKQLDKNDKGLQDLVKERVKKPLESLTDLKREQADITSTLQKFSTVLASIKEDVLKLKGGK